MATPLEAHYRAALQQILDPIVSYDAAIRALGGEPHPGIAAALAKDPLTYQIIAKIALSEAARTFGDTDAWPSRPVRKPTQIRLVTTPGGTP